MRASNCPSVVVMASLMVFAFAPAASALGFWGSSSARGDLIVSRRQSSNNATTNTTVASPILVAPSQYWEGNDGPWSSFPMRIGQPPQVVRGFPSTVSSNYWAIDPQGCPSFYPDTCADQRGGLFDRNKTANWDNIGVFSLGVDANLDISVDGQYGFTNTTIGYPGSGDYSQDRATVAVFATTTYWLGGLGLKPVATNFTNGNDPSPSFMQQLRAQNQIPSLSYGYTAGNRYRLTGSTFGSLTLGGYDAARVESNNITYPFFEDPRRDLLVGISEVTLMANGMTLGDFGSPFTAMIDSNVAFLYLPPTVCDVFERAFGLVYNSTVDYYLINSTQRAALLQQNPNVTFTLSPRTGGSSTETISITFPYVAFDKNISYPITAIGAFQTYFPLRRATNDTQYTLGRTFLQEAFLVADYERKTFTIAPCKWDKDTNTVNIKTITSTGSAQASVATFTGGSTATSSSSMTGKAIAGIVVAVIAIPAVLIASALLFVRRRHRRRREVRKLNGVEEDPFMQDPRGKYGELQGDDMTPFEMAENLRPIPELDPLPPGLAGATRGKQELVGHPDTFGAAGEMYGSEVPRYELEARGKDMRCAGGDEKTPQKQDVLKRHSTRGKHDEKPLPRRPVDRSPPRRSSLERYRDRTVSPPAPEPPSLGIGLYPKISASSLGGPVSPVGSDYHGRAWRGSHLGDLNT